MTSQTEVIEPEAAAVALSDGTQLRIAPIRVRQLPAFLRAIKPIIEAARAQGQGADDLDIAAILLESPDAVIEAVDAATGDQVSRETIDGLAIDDLARLAIAVIRVNADFFAQRVAPILAGTDPAASPGPGSSSA